MNRFYPEQKKRSILHILLPTLIFVFVLCFFSYGTSELSGSTMEKQQETLEAGLYRNIVQCYVEEGAYPESLAYLLSQYPVFYDDSLFFVDYHPIAANIMPDVTVICRRQP